MSDEKMAFGDVPGGKPVYDPRKSSCNCLTAEAVRRIVREEWLFMMRAHEDQKRVERDLRREYEKKESALKENGPLASALDDAPEADIRACLKRLRRDAMMDIIRGVNADPSFLRG